MKVLALLFVLTGAAGCLPDDAPVKGRLLTAGIHIESPRFVRFEDSMWVQYYIRKTRPSPVRSGTVDIHMVKWEDASASKLVITGFTERPDWPVVQDATGGRFYMTDEKIRFGLAAGTLNRVSLKAGHLESIPDVISYQLGATGQTFIYRKYVEGAPEAELHLRHVDGRDRNLGPLTGPFVLLGADVVYYVTGAEQNLVRAQGFEGDQRILRSKVAGFRYGNERLSILTVLDETAPARIRTVVADFEKKTERALPVDNPCCYTDWREGTYVFSEPATPGKPAALHYYTIETGADRVVPLPGHLTDASSMFPRPRAPEEYLLFDTRRNATIYRPLAPDPAPAGAKPRFEPLPFQPLAWHFSPEGKYLLSMVAEPPPPPPAIQTAPTGYLDLYDVDNFRAPPRRLSPKGASVPIDPRGYLIRDELPYPMVFWARFGLGASDLYVGNHETGLFHVVARGIGEISVGHTRVVGVMNLGQDLTGDLLDREYEIDDKGAIKVKTETVLERGVADVEFCQRPDIDCGHMATFIVRERLNESKRNGLWARDLRPDPMPATARILRARDDEATSPSPPPGSF